MFEYKMYEIYEINGVKCREMEGLVTICKNETELVERCRKFGAKGNWFVEKYQMKEKFGIMDFNLTLIDNFEIDLNE